MKLRPATTSDFESIAELFRAGASLYRDEDAPDEELLQWLTSPNVDLERNVRLAFDDHGRLLGYVDVDPVGERPVRWWSDVRLRPDADFEAAVPELLRWVERRADGGVIRVWVPVGHDSQARAYEAEGFRRIRGSYRMEVALADVREQPSLPDGIEVRTLAPGEERIGYEVHQETFADSWEHVSEPYEEWEHYLVESEAFDPSLWFVAWAGDEPAGVALCRDRSGFGFVGILGVRRPWRRLGLGRALLLHAFGEFRRRGYANVRLGVDAESLTGAHKLYESVGMRVIRELSVFEKPVGRS